MNKKYTLEELEAYLEGQLGSEARQEMEAELSANPSLHEELEVLKISKEAIELAAWRSLISKNQEEYLADREQDSIRSIQPERKSKNQWFGRFAASLTLLLVGLITVLFLSVSPESITSNQVEYSIPVLRSANNPLEILEKAYQVGDYDQVLEISETLEAFDTKAYFLIGLANLKKENAMQAESYFTQIESKNFEQGENNYADQVDYYLIEAYLIQGKVDQAKLRMKKIINDPQHTYHGNFDRWDLIKMKILELKM